VEHMHHPPIDRAEADAIPQSHLLIVWNPTSFSAAETPPRIDELEQLPHWENCRRIKTTQDDSFIDDLVANLQPKTTVAVFGGDGTVKRVVDALLGKNLAEGVALLIVGAGNKNDVAHMLHGEEHYNDPVTIAQNGQERTIYPLEAIISTPDGEERVERLVYSFSIGTAAIATGRFNGQAFINKQRTRGPFRRWLAERVLAIDAIMRTPVIRTNQGMMLDYTVAGGNRMAGGALKFDTELTEPNILVVGRTKSNPFSVLGSLIARKIGKGPGDRWVNGRDTIQVKHVKRPVPAQADGEVIAPIPAHTTIKLRRASQGITVLALK
jgi:hypothetical protein